MKNLRTILKTLGSSLALTLVAVFALSASARAIPYNGDNTAGLDHPAFNVFTGTPSVGDEPDFFRGKVEGTTGYINDVTSDCKVGTKFDLRVYVHNAASQALNDNGNGAGIARDTKVKVQVPGSTMDKFALSSTISASNAASVSDGMNINCNGKLVKLSYVAGSAQQYSIPGGTKALNDSIVTTGAPIGTVQPDGNVWGCWDQRVWVTLKLEVKETPTPKSLGECKVLTLEQMDDRKVKVNLSGTTENAEIVAYKIDFGDGTTSNKQSDTHQYAKDGTYTITGRVQIKFADGHLEWKTANDCVKQVKFESGKPVTPETPTTLTSTGAGDVVGIFAATSILGAVLHRLYAVRKAIRL